MERTKNALRNIITAIINKGFLLFFPFVIRTVIIQKLGSEYLGLSSLFTSILQVLNLTELGFTSAIVYNLYKPIAEKDKDKICALLNFYKKAYTIIGSIILALGLFLLPFLKYFITGDVPSDVNIYVLYLIYLGNTVISYYLFIYKTVLLTAHQRNDILNNINTILTIIQYIVQIALLFIFENYYVYVIVLPIITIINNIVSVIITNRKYPEYVRKGNIDSETMASIKKKVSGLVIIKICLTTRSSFANIFISMFLGLTVVAIYNNYYMVLTGITTLLGAITLSMLSGVGNSIVVDTKAKNYKDMIKFDFMYMWIAGWCAICLLCLFQPFMELWLGNEYLLPFGAVVLLVVYFYALKMGDIKSIYSEAAGLWWETRYRAIAETILNLVLCIMLGKLYGIYGILSGTLISLVIINFGLGSQIVFKHYFKNNKLKVYFGYHIIYFVVTSLIAIITLFLCQLVEQGGILGLVIKAGVCIVVPNIMYFIVYHKTNNFKDAKIFVFNILQRIKNKNK